MMFQKPVQKIQVQFTFDQNNEHFTCWPTYIYNIVLTWS